MRIPKKYQIAVNHIYKEAYDLGHERGHQKGVSDGKKETETSLSLREREADVQALQAISELARATGQTIDAMCRTRQNGRGM